MDFSNFYTSDPNMNDLVRTTVAALDISNQLSQATMISALTASLNTEQRDRIVEAVVERAVASAAGMQANDVANLLNKVQVGNALWEKHSDKILAAVADVVGRYIAENVGKNDYSWRNFGLGDVYTQVADKMAEAVKARVAADPTWLTDKLEASMVGKMLQHCVEEHARKLVDEAKKSAQAANAAVKEPGSTTT